MTAAGPIKPTGSQRGSVAHGVRAARGNQSREGSSSRSNLGAYALPSLGRAFALRALVGLTGENPDKRTGWTHVAYEGEWNGHPDGAFTLDAAAFESCVAAFDAQSNPLPVDFEHASVRNDVEKARAAGWVQSLEIRDDGLWALVEWTEESAADIRSGAYRYCSGVFVFDKPDRKTGEPVSCSLHSIGLTNTPFVDGQKPIALSQRRIALKGDPMEIERGAFEDALKALEGDKLTEAQLTALIKSVAEMAKAQNPDAEADSAELDIDVEVEEPETAAMSDEPKEDEKALSAGMPPEVPMADAPMDPAGVMAELESIAAAMGKDLPALLAYLKEMAAAGDSAASNPAALSAEVAALKTTVLSYGKQLAKYRARDEAEEKARVESEKRALSQEVDDMITQGVIVKADASAWRSLALADAKRFRALKSTLKPVVPTGREASAMAASAPSHTEVTEMPLDKSDPQVRALFDRFQTNWKVTDPTKLERLVRNALSIKRSAG